MEVFRQAYELASCAREQRKLQEVQRHLEDKKAAALETHSRRSKENGAQELLAHFSSRRKSPHIPGYDQVSGGK